MQLTQTRAGMNGSNGIVSGSLLLNIEIETNAVLPGSLADTIAEQVEAHLISSSLYYCEGADHLRIRISGSQEALIEWDDRDDDEEIDYENDPETDTAIELDEIIHPLPSNLAACNFCGEVPDSFSRCGCDY